MNFCLDEPLLDAVELEEGEEAVEVPTQKCEIVAKVEDLGEECKPRYYMSFRRKSGHGGLFSKFVKEVMSQKLSMFVEKA